MDKGINSKEQWNKKRKTLVGILGVIFIGFLVSEMVTMMYLGGAFNTKNFLSSGVVYDFPQKELKDSTQGWIYEEGINGHRMGTNGALKIYSLNGKVQKWNYLYVDIADMSIPQFDALICYYGMDKKKVLEQAVILSAGENIIALRADVPMAKIGIRILNASGEYLSIDSMQIRTTISGYTPKRMVKIFSASYGGFLLLFLCSLLLWRRFGRNIAWTKKIKNGCYVPIELLQYVYEVFGDAVGQKMGGRLTVKQKSSIRILLFSLLFFSCMAGNAMNWSINKGYFRYHVLLCAILIIITAAVSWEKPLKPVEWKKPLAISWMSLSLAIIISDMFVTKSLGMVGLTLLLPGGYFIFAWGNLKNKKNMICNMLTALEIVFFIGTAYCMLFRTKKAAIYYNGLFRSADECSMYGVLMLGVFLTALDKDIRKSMKCELGEWKKYALHLTGAAISCYFILRAGHITGFVTAIILFLLFAVKQRFLIFELKKNARIIAASMLRGCLIAFGVVCMVHISTKYLPHFLDLEVEYKNEKLTTGVDDELKEAFNVLEPGLMDGVEQKEDMELFVVWKNYIRRLNLFGNGEPVLKIFRIPAMPENGYLMLAYRYGIFILVPYIIWQICFLREGIKKFRKKKELFVGTDVNFWLLAVSISFAAFCIYGNVEAVFGHPLWLCCYLGMGIWFCKESRSTEKYLESE